MKNEVREFSDGIGEYVRVFFGRDDKGVDFDVSDLDFFLQCLDRKHRGVQTRFSVTGGQVWFRGEHVSKIFMSDLSTRESDYNRASAWEKEEEQFKPKEW